MGSRTRNRHYRPNPKQKSNRIENSRRTRRTRSRSDTSRERAADWYDGRVDGELGVNFDAAVFLLSLQDMEPLDTVIGQAAKSLGDRHLSPLAVPMGRTTSFHKPLGMYVEALARHLLALDRLVEIPEDEGRTNIADSPLFP